MQSNINAFGIIAVVLITLFIVGKLHVKSIKELFKLKKIILAIIIFLAVCLFNIVFSVHQCLAGQPLYQWLIPAICIFTAIIAIGIPLLIALVVVGIVFPILGAVKAYNGEVWPYPFSIRFFK